MRLVATAVLVASLAGLAQANELTPYLPPAELVTRVLRASPGVRAAGGQVGVEEAHRRRLEAGSYEWNLRIGGQQRRTYPAGAPDQRFGEWNAALERPMRLPGKAALDAELGAAGVSVAQIAFEDAVHEAQRSLLRTWFTWLKEGSTAAQWAEQVSLLAQQAEAVRRRQQLGDAARLEAVQADAARAQAEASLAQARVREQVAAEDLRRRFPGLPLTAPQPVAEPQPIPGSEGEWVEAIVAQSHELGRARREAQRVQLGANRVDRERMPDPTFGVLASHERGGEEQVIGAYISIALPGAARRASADAARAEADVAYQREAAALQQVSAEAATLVRSASAARAAWQAGDAAAAGLGSAADMASRAYRLGEGSLDNLLIARRLANEARLAARLMALEALELRYRLLLDAHRLWNSDDDTPAGDRSGGLRSGQTSGQMSDSRFRGSQF
jgi:outer membrane protein, heavy metal efflux system